MKKVMLVLLAFVLIFSMTACSASDSAPGGGGYRPGGAMNGAAGGLKGDADMDIMPEAPMEGEAAGDVMEDGAVDENGNIQRPVAGTLTAGEWKDLDDFEFWQKVLNNNEWYRLMEQRNLYTNQMVPVLVQDAEGNPCFNVVVQLLNEQGVVYEARTDVDGYAYLFHGLNKQDDGITKVKVGSVEYDIPEDELKVTAEAAGVKVTQLDLMFMIDTTGSMGDELEYLQEELADVISRVSYTDQALSINLSVNFYRDAGDDYVVREFEFTGDITKAVRYLKEQKHDGGGDYAEAVHKALDSIVNNHQWRNNAVKLCFFVLDAPPHTNQEIKNIDADMLTYVKKAAKEGIRIIPLAASGVNTETEFLLRSWAAMTGGTYTFLTDHSGIGGDHLEPTIGEYKVEALNECLIRVICEYCGLPYKLPNQ